MPQPTSDKYVNLLSSKLNLVEAIVGVVFLVVVLMRMMMDLFIDQVLIIALATLAVFYFFRAFQYANQAGIGQKELFIDKLGHIGLSVAVLGILFRLQSWSGSERFLLLGAITVGASLLLSFIMKSPEQDENGFPLRNRIRFLLVAAITIALYLVSSKTLVDINLIHDVMR